MARALSPPVIPAQAGTQANRRLFIADVEAVARRNVCRNNQFADVYVGPGLRRDDGCGWGSFSRADTAFVARCSVHFGARNDRRPPTTVILGLVPRTQGAAGFMVVEQVVEAACSACCHHLPGGWLGPRADARG
jgi:hypothetical protein